MNSSYSWQQLFWKEESFNLCPQQLDIICNKSLYVKLARIYFDIMDTKPNRFLCSSQINKIVQSIFFYINLLTVVTLIFAFFSICFFNL